MTNLTNPTNPNKKKLLELLLILITVQIATVCLIFEDDFEYFGSFFNETFFLLLLNNSTSTTIIRAARTLRPKTLGYWTDVFPNLRDDTEYNTFKSHFRITRITFNLLLHQLARHPLYQSDSQTRIEIQVAIVIWRLGTGSGFRVLEQTMGIKIYFIKSNNLLKYFNINI